MPALEHLVLASVTYLIGSFPSAVLVCNFMGVPDPRQHGSGNPGATNVLRVGNYLAAALTLTLDITKGFVAILLAQGFHLPHGIIAILACAVVLGHAYPLPNGKRGGKGVATSLGALLAITPVVGLSLLSFWLVVALSRRQSSLASVCTALLAPLLGFLFAPEYLLAFGVIAIVLFITHRDNIKRLIAGTEARF
ncbi:MAG: glycerol-3-phosphate 1-O-acyltransferase PlsY [Pontibacterium sp.]